MADLSYVASTNGTDSTLSVATIDAGVPAGTVSGHGQVIWYSSAVITGGGAPTHTTPSGWTLAGTTTYTGLSGLDGRLSCYLRIAGGSEATVTLTSGGNSAQQFIRQSFANPDAANFLDAVPVWSTSSSGTSHAIPSITTTVPRAMLSAFLAATSAGITWTPPGGMTERVEANSSTAADQIVATAGATGTRTFTSSASTAVAYGMVALRSEPLTISAQPADQTVNNGATANFSVTAAGGTAPLSYQWKFNGSNVGTNSSSYSRTADYADQGGQVTVVVTDANSLTVTSNAATLRIAFNTTGTGPRAYPNLGGPIGAGPVESWLRGTDAGGGGSSAPVGLGSETDTALALTGRQTRAVGLATETDTAFARTVVSARATGLATETDTALALARIQIRATGLAVETDTAFARGSARPAGVSAETDTAFALTSSAGAAVGLAVETDTALALSGRQILATGLASETDTALALAAFTGTQVGTASETDTALQLAGRQIRAVGLSLETDVALALAAASVRQAGVATETDTALSLAARQIRVVGLANETDTALALLAGGAVQVGLATETDTAFALAGEQIGGIVIPQTSFAEFSGAVVKTKQEPKRARLRAPKPVERKKAAPKLEPIIAPVGMAIEEDEALALAGWSVQRGLYRTKPIATYPRLTREHCSHCGAPVSAHQSPKRRSHE